MIEYEKDGAEIYRRSFAMIRSEADLDGIEPPLARVIVRMIHACGMVDLVGDVDSSPGLRADGDGSARGGRARSCATRRWSPRA